MWAHPQITPICFGNKSLDFTPTQMSECYYQKVPFGLAILQLRKAESIKLWITSRVHAFPKYRDRVHFLQNKGWFFKKSFCAKITWVPSIATWLLIKSKWETKRQRQRLPQPKHSSIYSSITHLSMSSIHPSKHTFIHSIFRSHSLGQL